ncbi:plasmid replication initiator protein [Streptomyces sp. GMY02]|uniref:replication initiator n=1 Tax=Streptomyces sp. GMY02 TaxID=1333528 RepID=UPI001C2C1B30|nr:replication initiator [Streptomyces sp. GMY02]QXE34004.1 plasmid replication initiator protein [Streptomyces sp. GMY02]
MNALTRRPVHPAGRLLSDTEADLIRLAQEPGFRRWLDQITATGGCSHPIYLSGRTTTLDASNGTVLRHYDTTTEPGGRLAVRCRNRRASLCQPCARLHSADTFHLVRAGLLGGKNVPTTVGHHPRLFVTLTAPSWGPVHRATEGGPCHPRRNGGSCEHNQPVGCGLAHAPDHPAVGQPVCPRCYDYSAHVLWHAHAGVLWNRTTGAIRRRLAAAAGTSQARVSDHLRLSFAKVTEYQRRGAVHFHAVIRLDGPDGPASPPPVWATAELLTGAVRAAAASVTVSLPYSPGLGEHTVRWGAQLDIDPIHHAFTDESPVTDQAVAAYVAKYVSKSVGDSAGGTDHRITSPQDIALAPASGHVRALMGTCWRLGGLRELEHLHLRAWAHTLGYRGHVLTKSIRYSTTYGELRAARARHAMPSEDLGPTGITESAWRYVGSGHTPGAAAIATGIAQDLATLRDILREERSHAGWRPPHAG